MSSVVMHSGAMVDLPDIESADINKEDIIHSLAHQCRFGGHTEKFYSVAQHSLALHHMTQSLGCSYGVQLFALLHNAEEAYIGDITHPGLACISGTELCIVQSRIRRAISDSFSLRDFESWGSNIAQIVGAMDANLCCVEGFFLLPNSYWVRELHDSMQDQDYVREAFKAFHKVADLSISQAASSFREALTAAYFDYINDRR